MSMTRLHGGRRIALGLAWMSALACNSDPEETVPGGQPCERSDQCEGGWVCYEQLCRQVCNRHQDCDETEICDPGVCLPVADYECAENADCDEPSQCQTVLGAECYAGRCHYRADPAADGLPCDDGNKCTSNDACASNGTCRGQELVCDTPPDDSCLQDDSVVRRYESAGGCNPSLGVCEYEYNDSECADCRHACLGVSYVPANLAASAGDAQVTLTWEPTDFAQSYNVYVAQTVGETAAAEPVSAASSPHVETGLDNGTTYYFAVSAVTDVGERELSAEVSATPRISAPAGPSARGGNQQVTLTWDAVSGADRYYLYWAQEPGVTLDSNRLTAVTSPYVHDSLSNNATYYYAVAAVDGPSESVLSDEVSASTFVDAGTKLVASAAAAGDFFGGSAALSGDYAIIGGNGFASVFHRTGANAWDADTEFGPLIAQQFGGMAVSLSGDYAILGTVGAAEVLLGAARVFCRAGVDGWDGGADVLPAGHKIGTLYGLSIAVSGDYAVVGAPYADGSADDAGAAYVFHRTGENTWDTGTKLVGPDGQADDAFGSSVALSGDYAIVGAPREDGGDGDLLADAGAAYVFHRTGENTWDTGTKLVGPDGQADDGFGLSVGLSGDFAVVGVPEEDGGDGDPLPDAGAAYVFYRTGENTWDTGTKLVAPDAQANDAFGSVAVSGDYVIVGAPGEDWGDGDPLTNAGSAYLFRRMGESVWTSTKLVAPDAEPYDGFGGSVSLSSGHAIVGARGEDGGAGDPLADAGAAYVYAY